jgi:hypothetical protein
MLFPLKTGINYIDRFRLPQATPSLLFSSLESSLRFSNPTLDDTGEGLVSRFPHPPGWNPNTPTLPRCVFQILLWQSRKEA